MNDCQHTLEKPVRYSGIALHTGVRAHLDLDPAPPDSGIHLERVDLAGTPGFHAHANNVTQVQRATTLGEPPACIHTVEHVLATLYALGIDNAVVRMDGPEPPIADGSAKPYVDAVLEAGLQAQNRPRHTFTVDRTYYYEAGETRLVMLPDDEYRISCTIQFGRSAMDCQYLSIRVTPEVFANDLAGARTFCAYDEIAQLMVAGLIRGGSLDNAVVMKDNAIVSKDGLRWPDEFVRHKILDLIGDLSLVGRRLRGHVIAIKPGHEANVSLARQLVNSIEQDAS